MVESLHSRMLFDLDVAMRSNDDTSKAVLRAVLTEFDPFGRPPSDIESGNAKLLRILQARANERRWSAEAHEQAGRSDLASRERAELAILRSYLPPTIDPNRLKTVVAEEVARAVASSLSGPWAPVEIAKAVVGRLGDAADWHEVREAVDKSWNERTQERPRHSESATPRAPLTVRHFSGAPPGGDFSLRSQMAAVGVSSIDDLLAKLARAQSKAAELQNLAHALASIPLDDDLGRVLARMMFAGSRVRVRSDTGRAAGLNAALEIGGISGPESKDVARYAAMTIVAGIDAARQTGQGNACVVALQSIAEIWCRDLPPGSKALGGRYGRPWVVAAVLLYLAELCASPGPALDAVADSLQGGSGLSPHDEMRVLWNFGRSWASANGTDFDAHLRRHT